MAISSFFLFRPCASAGDLVHLLRPNFKGGERTQSERAGGYQSAKNKKPAPLPYTWVKGGKGRLWCVFPFDRSRKLCFRSPGWFRAGPKKENFMVYDESRDEDSARPTLGQQPGCNSRNSLTRRGLAARRFGSYLEIQ